MAPFLQTISYLNADQPLVVAAFVFVLGAGVGSFLNVCILRIPIGKSIVRPRSQCACGRSIPFYDNLPVLSWFILRGRARCCGRPFSFRYPAIELFTAVLFVACWFSTDPGRAIAGLIFLSFLILVAMVDFDHLIIPESFSLPLCALGLALSALFPSLHPGAFPFHSSPADSFMAALTGLLIGSSVLLWVAILGEAVLKKEAMGFGDVQLMGAVGAFLGWKLAIVTIFGAAVLSLSAVGCVLLAQFAIGRTILLKDPTSGERTAKLGLGVYTPFGPCLAASAAGLYLLRDHWSVLTNLR